jgi:hypothetical protein
MSTLITQIMASFGEIWAREVLSNNSIFRANLARAPQALNPATGFSIFNLRSFLPVVTTGAATVSLIYFSQSTLNFDREKRSTYEVL